MPRFSRSSMEHLDTCHASLVDLFNVVIKSYDCTIIEGHRPLERQKELVRSGLSKVNFSKHNHDPSFAVDVAPYPIDWNDTERFYMFGGYVLGVARMLGSSIRWGGDWDRDTQVKDQTFMDLVHFELYDKTTT